MDVVRPQLTAEATAGLSASVTAAPAVGTAADFTSDVTSSNAKEALLLQDNSKPSSFPSLLQSLPSAGVVAALLNMRLRNPGATAGTSATNPTTATVSGNGHTAGHTIQLPSAIPLSSIAAHHTNSRPDPVKTESFMAAMETDGVLNDSLASPPALIIPSTEQPNGGLNHAGSQEHPSAMGFAGTQQQQHDAVPLPCQAPRSLQLSHKVSPVPEAEMDALFGPKTPALPLSLVVQLEVDGQLQAEAYDKVMLKQAQGSYYLSGLPYQSCQGYWHAGWRREADSADGRPRLVRVLVSKEDAAREAQGRCTRHVSTMHSAAPSTSTAAAAVAAAAGAPAAAATALSEPAAAAVAAAAATVAAVPASAAPPRPIASFGMRVGSTSHAAVPEQAPARPTGVAYALRAMLPPQQPQQQQQQQQQDLHNAHASSVGGALVDSAGYVMGGPGSLSYPQKRYLDGYKTVSFVRTSELKQLFGPDARTLLPLECTMKVELDGVPQPGISNVTFKETGANNSVYYIKGFKASLGLYKLHCGFKRDSDGTVVLLLRNLPPGDESQGMGGGEGGGRGRGRGGRGMKREFSGSGGAVSKRGRGGRGRTSWRGGAEAALMKQLQDPSEFVVGDSATISKSLSLHTQEEEEDEEERWAAASWEDPNADASQQQQQQQPYIQQQQQQQQPPADDSGLTVSDVVDADEQLDMMVCASAAANAAAMAAVSAQQPHLPQNGMEASSGNGTGQGARQQQVDAGWQQVAAAAMGQLTSMLAVAELEIQPPVTSNQHGAGQQQHQAARSMGAARNKLGSMPWMGASEGLKDGLAGRSRPPAPSVCQAHTPPPAIQNPWLPSSNRGSGGSQSTAAMSGAGAHGHRNASPHVLPRAATALIPQRGTAAQAHAHGLAPGPHHPAVQAKSMNTSSAGPAAQATAQPPSEPAPTHPAAALLPAYVHAGLVDASSPLPVLLLDQPSGAPPRATDLRCALSGVLQAMRHLGAGQPALLAAFEAFHALQGAQLTTFLHSTYTLLAVAHSSGLRDMVLHALGLGLGPQVVQLMQGTPAAPTTATPARADADNGGAAHPTPATATATAAPAAGPAAETAAAVGLSDLCEEDLRLIQLQVLQDVLQRTAGTPAETSEPTVTEPARGSDCEVHAQQQQQPVDAAAAAAEVADAFACDDQQLDGQAMDTAPMGLSDKASTDDQQALTGLPTAQHMEAEQGELDSQQHTPAIP